MTVDDLGPVHTSPAEFKNGGFTLKTLQMLSVHTPPKEFKNATISGRFGFLFGKKLGRGNRMITVMASFSSFFFCLHENEKLAFPVFTFSSGLKSFLENLRFVTD